jgi:hypothetical protein
MADNPLDIHDKTHEERIRETAYHLWEEEGRPQGRDLEYWERARELVGIEESRGAGLLPNPMTNPMMATGEEAEIQQNLGEFPDRFADQGEWQPTPEPKHSKRKRKNGVETKGAKKSKG